MPSVTQHKYEVRRPSNEKERLGRDWGSLGGRDLKSGRMGIICMNGRDEGKEH
jgi:hypothetical protein